ncbi:hypothetical protein PULV_a3692 [Pseudoalteromonas ulvae UL12]|uniref:Fis family transcriptional regulator n=1 Tax=Pseudoalteromonas ulvae TaxID=107327 RepID=A0A244CKX5_PSEDV|nr:sigma 54-interacting transcriptional regulator [Pseudoalteromonas ulvae]MBE0362015.1 hypothetical protein [Pseudoalteromonas ulvae UL12]OUL55996.1 Fis family transcriptional regulator [Pseudoalteromonas ulvae]
MHSLKDLLADSDLLLNAAGEGIYGFDLEGNAVFINPAAERMTGWKSQELLGKKIHQYHHHSHKNGQCYPAHECQIYATLQDGQPRHVNNEVFWRKDGSYFDVEYTSTPVYHQGEIVGAVALFRDVSQQKQTEQALRDALKEIQALSEKLQAENVYLQRELSENWPDSGLVGQSQIFQTMLNQLALVSKTDSTVLILGENGTGKELVARNVHQLSQRKHAPLVKVNCAAFSDNLLESELFGHEKGSFTGANERRKGRFELANKGTLFLDEIGELSLAAQSKLLRVLQEQEFERVGGNQTIHVDIRIIAATNRNLLEMVEQGRFRMDLYYRLNVFPIQVPALRERKEDIPMLCLNILQSLNKKLGKHIDSISQQSLTKLSGYSWPGNIRELQNILEREAILSQRSTLNISQKLHHVHSSTDPHFISLDEVQKNYIVQVLNHCNWVIGGEKGAAKQLNLADSTLRSKMQKLDIKRSKTRHS